MAPQTFSVRVHGRGGQGVVTAAELIAAAAFAEGRHALAFPTFGSERTGAPVTAYCRISDRPIRSHDPVSAPDVVIVQDPTLLHDPSVLAGTGPGTVVVVNTVRPAAELGVTVTVAATEIGRRLLGRPLPGSALLGAFAAVCTEVGPESLATAARRRFGGALGEANAEAVAAGYAAVAPGPREPAGA